MKSFKEMVQSLPKKEEIELTEANHREFASQGLMHPDMAKHMKTGQEMDFYHSKTGDKISGVVKKNLGGQVHIQANKDGKIGGGEVHKFTVSSKLNEAKDETPPFDGPYKTTKGDGSVKDKSGAVHTPMSRARDLARQAMKKQMKEEEGIDLSDEQADELMLEALIGGQKKLDKNKNGKIDSGDLKMIRGEACPECGKSPCECGHMKEEKEKYAGLEALKKMGLPTAARSSHPRGVNIDTVEGWDHPHDAVKKKEVKEETEVEVRTVSFKNFINEIKMADLPSRRIKGTSYGAQYHDPEGDDDADEKRKQVAKSEPAVKRGRGRPAGSKSGANQKVTSGRKGSGVDYTGYKLHLPNTNR